ncbi:DUF397 domain-containing protein [Nocardia flavorosea]|uniref:DUF397 domain-containing protein n=1 Tax=Nocardia flavorosea TaxID=53429 RepID=A0A846YHY3_9NOCA|nr:DUF397 domain-containing protein [Nocardia flavorosea]NKY58513.1 DUF397 domain-containing protein [Nocardia flavorosea]
MNYELPGAQWFKSSHSGTANECVEVAWLGDTNVGVRDSKHAAGPALVFRRTDWAAFTTWLGKGGATSA